MTALTAETPASLSALNDAEHTELVDRAHAFIVAAVGEDLPGMRKQASDLVQALDPLGVLAKRIDDEKSTAASTALLDAAADPALRLSGHSGISVTRLRRLGRDTEETRS